MGSVHFKHGAPNYGKSPVYPDNMKAQAFWIEDPISRICHVDDTISPILIPTDTGAAHSLLSRRCLFQFFLLDYKLLQA